MFLTLVILYILLKTLISVSLSKISKIDFFRLYLYCVQTLRTTWSKLQFEDMLWEHFKHVICATGFVIDLFVLWCSARTSQDHTLHPENNTADLGSTVVWKKKKSLRNHISPQVLHSPPIDHTGRIPKHCTNPIPLMRIYVFIPE